jgi:hypothetical protein
MGQREEYSNADGTENYTSPFDALQQHSMLVAEREMVQMKIGIWYVSI